jgi:DNA (cytosine-5)-methyltransferase 1
MLTIGSLFSGIGGLELGLEMAGLGPVCWQVEINPHARAVLAAHWPEVTRHDDVCTVGATTLASVDLICGGFPCQDVSSAGKRAGLGGARSGLWAQFRRIVSEIRPQWVVVENVSSGARAWVDAVARELGELGYGVLPVPLEAADVGAPHARARVFLIAISHAHQHGQHAEPEHAKMASAPTASDALCSGPQGDRAESHPIRQRLVPCGWGAPIPDVLRVVHGVSGRLDASRPRIRALGNAVVPQCAEVVGQVIRQLIEGPA